MKKKARKPYAEPRMRVKKFGTFFFYCACSGGHGATSCSGAGGLTNKAIGICYS